MKKILIIISAFMLTSCFLVSQVVSSPYNIKKSEKFNSPKGYAVLPPLGYGNKGIIQVSAKRQESFSFQKFSPNLVLEKENIVSTNGKIPKNGRVERMIQTKNKTYLFVRNSEKEGITTLEFFPDQLDFAPTANQLFESSAAIYMQRYKTQETAPKENTSRRRGYGFCLSNDKTKFMYNYKLANKSERNELNKVVLGVFVFDENLNKISGKEYILPYTEAYMDNLGYTLSNNGVAYMLARVYSKDDDKATKNANENYHYEVLVFDKDKTSPETIELKLKDCFPQDSYIYEDLNNDIIIAGLYSKTINDPTTGIYVLKLESNRELHSKITGGTYQIPVEIIKLYSSDREKRKLARKTQAGKMGIEDLTIRKAVTTPNGSVKIVAEQFDNVMSSDRHYAYTKYPVSGGAGQPARYSTAMETSSGADKVDANDIFIFSINAGGVVEWVKKIPKSQTSSQIIAPGLSFVSSFSGDDVTVFYVDNIKNENLSEDHAPYLNVESKGGYIAGVKIDSKGVVTRYNLGDTKSFHTNFFIRYFVDGGKKNLINTARRKGKNILFSIEEK